jgi:septum formation protein
MAELILGSTSVYRRQLLERMGVTFRCEPPGVDEDAYKLRGLTPDALAQLLAREKALKVSERFPGAVVIGSDQVAELDGHVFDKPGTVERACEQLAQLQGRTHRLITAVCVVDATGGLHEFVNVYRLTMRALTDAQIQRYVERDQPLDCCGSFRIESLGVALFSDVEGDDPTAIEGLPLMELTSVLSTLGMDPLGLDAGVRP